MRTKQAGCISVGLPVDVDPRKLPNKRREYQQAKTGEGDCGLRLQGNAVLAWIVS
jgi:hypothetical protein